MNERTNDLQDPCAESDPGPGLEDGPAWQGGWQQPEGAAKGLGVRREGIRQEGGGEGRFLPSCGLVTHAPVGSRACWEHAGSGGEGRHRGQAQPWPSEVPAHPISCPCLFPPHPPLSPFCVLQLSFLPDRFLY